jgi:hypothetical protein
MGGDRDPAEGLDRAGLRDLLAKGWLTHDGMWFDEAARAHGVEAANDLNRAAIRAMVPFEVSRLCEALRVDPAGLSDAAAVARFVGAGIRLVTPESVSGHLRVEARDGALHWEWDEGECFAYRGMQRYGWLDGYRCGVIYRIECWLEALGVRSRGAPVVELCAMHPSGRCAGDLRLSLSA